MKMERSKEYWERMARLEGDAEIGVAGGSVAMDEYEARKVAVFTAARQADHRYDGGAPDSQGMSRPEYVGRAVLAVLHV